MLNLYDVGRKSIFNGVEYTVVMVLDNDLLLAVPTKEIENKQFPISTVIIPDDITM